MNIVVVSGRVGADPEFYIFDNNGKSNKLSKVRIAINNFFKRHDTGEFDQKTVWLTVKSWKPSIVRVMEVLKKGDEIVVEGYLASDIYEDKQGVKREVFYVTPRKIIVGRVLSKKNLNEEPTSVEEFRQELNKPAPPSDDFDDEVPF